MYPDLWSIPGINFEIRSYGFAIGIGMLLALWIGIRRAKRVGLRPGIVTNILLIGGVLGVVGCKAMYLVHHRAAELASVGFNPLAIIRLADGGEILGGVILAGLGIGLYLAISGQPVLRYLDLALPPTILAMGVGRIGCLMFGCCWGGVCESPTGERGLPWAVRFPYGSPPHLHQYIEGQLDVPAQLMMKVPGQEQHGPIPRRLLASDDIGDPDFVAYIETFRQYSAAKQKGTAPARADELRAQLVDWQDKLGPISQNIAALAAGAHVNRLNRASTDGKSVSWADLRALAATQSSRWAQPAQLYDAISLVLLFVVLSVTYARTLDRPGMVLALGMVLYPINRVLQEIIRTDNPRDVAVGFGQLTISEAISGVLFLVGLAWLLMLWGKRRRPAPTLA